MDVWVKAGHTVEIIRELLPEFTEQTGIDVHLTVVPEDVAYASLRDGTQRPDVVTCPFWYLDELVALGVVAPLRLDDVGRKTGDFPATALAALTRAGQLYAVPHTLTGGVLSYRADILNSYDISQPRTLDDVIAAANTIRRALDLRAPLIARANPEFSSLETYAGWAAAKGIQLLPDQGAPDQAALEEGIGDLVAQLRQAPNSDRLVAADYNILGAEMQADRAVMMFDTSAWPYLLDSRTSPVAGRMGYTVITDITAAQFMYAEGLAVTSWSPHREAAQQFIRWRHSHPVIQAEVDRVGRFDLPRLDVHESEWFRAAAHEAGANEWLAVIRSAWEHASLDHVPQRTDFVPRAREIMRAISATIAGGYPSLSAAHEATYPG